MKYVNMHDVAFDPAVVAFPGLGHCHGVVYQTNTGLFAMHIYGGPDRTPNKAIFFGDFVKRHMQGAGAAGARLYGLCPSIRFQGLGGKAGQKAELQVCARALSYTGPIEGAMWDLATLGWGTTYVEVNANGAGKVQVRIENFTDQPFNMTPNPSYADQKTVFVATKPFQTEMEWGSLKPLDSVITNVVRKPNTPSAIIQTLVL